MKNRETWRKRLRLASVLLAAAMLFLLVGCAQEQTICTDAARFPAVFQEHPYLRTGYIVFPETIPASALENGAEFFDYASDDFLDPTAEIVLRCTYDETDFSAELDRLANLVKRSPEGEKPLLTDDGTRFSVPAYLAQYNEDRAFEYAVVTGPREITYVYLSFREPDQIERVPDAALPIRYAQLFDVNDAGAAGEESFNVYEFRSAAGSSGITIVSYTDSDLPLS